MTSGTRASRRFSKWLLENKRRCEQQAYFSVDPKDPTMPEKIIVEKIRRGDFV